MAVSSISSIRRFSNSVMQRAINVVPKMTVSSEKVNKALGWIGNNISTPQNRFILGVTALATQPFIDLKNKQVDEDTRKVSAARTVAKIIAGTTTGVLIRSACIHAIDAFTKMPHEITEGMKFKKFRQLFMPNPKLINDLNQYKKSLGSILALFVMLFTNFLIDAPFTKYMTNKFIDMIHKKDAKKASVVKEAANE